MSEEPKDSDVPLTEKDSLTFEESQAAAERATAIAATDNPSLKQLVTEWQTYFSQLEDNYMKKVIDEATKEEFHIGIKKVVEGKKIKNPFTGEDEEVYKGFERKKFERKKLSQSEWLTLEKLRAAANRERDKIALADKLAAMYEYAALKFLEMSPNEFKRTDWEEIKVTLDACIFRTEKGLPYSHKPSTTSSTSRKQG